VAKQNTPKKDQSNRETINRSISFAPGDFEFLEYLGKFQRNENRSAVVSVALKALWDRIQKDEPTGLHHPKDWPHAILNHFNQK
jgi:hypothetical protein